MLAAVIIPMLSLAPVISSKGCLRVCNPPCFTASELPVSLGPRQTSLLTHTDVRVCPHSETRPADGPPRPRTAAPERREDLQPRWIPSADECPYPALRGHHRNRLGAKGQLLRKTQSLSCDQRVAAYPQVARG